MKLGEEDVDASQIEIAEMDIAIGDGLQPGAQVGGLRIAGDKQQAACAYRPLKQSPLTANHAKVLHILYTYDNDILGDGERLPVGDEQETAFLWGYCYFTPIQRARNRLVCVDRETRA